MHSENEKIARTLRFSLLDGFCASAMVGFTQDYFAPFLLFLGGSSNQVGLLNAFSNLGGAFAQLGSADITVKLRSRRKVVNFFVLCQALTLIPMFCVAFIGRAHPAFFIALAVLFSASGALSLAPWQSIMSDLIEENQRGNYFGWRYRLLGFVTVAFSFLAGFILYISKLRNAPHIGFAAILCSAFLFRVCSWYFLTLMHEPALEHKKEDAFSIIDFLRRMRSSNFARFVLFVALMNFSVNLAAPFFVVLMLRDLHFSYLLYSCITITATLTVYAAMRRWGRYADTIGNLKVVTTVSKIIAVVPLLWVISRNPVFLFFAQVVSGFAWAGFNLCSLNFAYDAVTPEKRTRCLAYFNFLNGVALFAGALIGGFLVSRLPALLGLKIISLLLISSAVRLLVSFVMPRGLKEVRQVEPISDGRLLVQMLGAKPFYR